VVAFADNVARSVVGTPMKIEFHRSDVVSAQFGAIRQDAADELVVNALKTGLGKEAANSEGMRFMLPKSANGEYLACHTPAKKGDVLGVIDIRAGYGELMGDTCMHLMLVLLLLAPLSLVAGFVDSVLLDSRVDRFVRQLDAAIERWPCQVRRPVKG